MLLHNKALPFAPNELNLLSQSSSFDFELVGGGDCSSSNESSLLAHVLTPLAIKVGLACLLAQCLLYVFFQNSSLSRGSIWSEAPGYNAHQVIVLLVMTYLVCQGTVEWFSDRAPQPDADRTAMDRILQGNHFSDIILGMMVFWDIPVTMAVKQLRNVPMMIHHVAMMMTAAISMGVWSNGRRLFGYYAPFFFGITEVSTFPLVVMAFLDSNPDLVLSSPKLQTLQDLAGPLFAFLFLTVRAIYFPYVSATRVLPDIVKVASKGICVRPLYAMALSNALFTVLQVYWGSLIVQSIMELVRDTGT